MEELNNQKNIAHGLELEVRELQSELQAEKKAHEVPHAAQVSPSEQVRELQSELQAERKALAAETNKEHALQQKLDQVRAIVDDSSIPRASTNESRIGRGLAVPAAPMPPLPVGEVDQLSNANAKKQSVPAPEVSSHRSSGFGDVGESPPTDSKTSGARSSGGDTGDAEDSSKLIAEAPDSEPESADDNAAQQALERQAFGSPSTHEAAREHDDAALGVHQSVAAETPSFGEAPSVQSAPGNSVPAKHSPRAKPSQESLRTAAKPAAAAKPNARQLRVAPRAAQAPVVAPSPPRPAPAAKDPKGVEAGADFDALEAQLHEEDRRIQDLDRENALDTTYDAGLPPGVSAAGPNHAQTKTMPAQPKLELDTEAPMEDFLNVEAPSSDSVGEAAAPNGSPPADAAPGEEGLALPQVGGLALPQVDVSDQIQVADSVGTGLDAALSDEKFLAQMAPSARH
jgi:hypothetical protein